MTSGFRTLMLFPEGELPFMLKFSGAEWFLDQKLLTPEQVRTSVERSMHLRRDLTLVPEPAGLLRLVPRHIVADPQPPPARSAHAPVPQPQLNPKAVAVIYRPLPLPLRRQLQPGDMLLPAHVVLAESFAKTKLGRDVFSLHGSQLAWLQKELAPRIARIVFRSLRRSFAHLELHGQNIDLQYPKQYPLVFGYVGEVPVAIRRAAGLVEQYYFRFE